MSAKRIIVLGGGFAGLRGAVSTEGWDRQLVQQRTAAKQTKQLINRQRIYPPMTRDRRDILAAAAPAIQPPPRIPDSAKNCGSELGEGSPRH